MPLPTTLRKVLAIILVFVFMFTSTVEVGAASLNGSGTDPIPAETATTNDTPEATITPGETPAQEATAPEMPAPTAPMVPTPTPAAPAPPQIAAAGGIFTYDTVADGIRITGFVAGQEATDVVIPDAIDGVPVTEIGDRAFMQKNIGTLTLGANVVRIGQYAFAANNLTTLTLSDSLKLIGAQAFRDNRLTTLNTKNVETLNKEAFANNKLTEVVFGAVKHIGDAVFINNDLTQVSVPASVEQYGTGVFAYNDRYVLVETTNPLIQTEVVPNGFGQVVNPVTVTVHFVDADTQEKILSDQIIGDDFTKIDGLIFLNQENTYTPPAITGYQPVTTPVTYTPDSTAYELTVLYRSTQTKPVIELVKTPVIAENGDGSEAVLRSFVKATDLNGKDISASIILEPSTIDTSVPGPIQVTYQVTDELGNTASRTVSVLVGTDWYQFPLGNGWVLGDFTYDGNKVTGLTDTGLEKAKTQKELILPHINPADGVTVIDTVGVNANNTTSFRSKGFTSVADYADNIRMIQGRYSATSSAERDPGAFSNNAITQIDLPALSYVGREGFRGNRLTDISFPELTFLGATAFGYNQLTTIDLPKVQEVDVWGLGNNQLTQVDMPSLQTIQSAGFINNQIAAIHLPQLTTVGPNAFAANKLPALVQDDVPKLTVIGNGSFRNNLIATIDLPLVTEIEDRGLQNNAIATVQSGGLDSLTTIGYQAFQNNQLTELTIPNLTTIAGLAFDQNPGAVDYNNYVVIWTDNANVPSKENYLINPVEAPPVNRWVESDFIWDTTDTGKVLGFSSTGKQKLPEMGYNVVFPDRATTIGATSFNGQNIVSVAGAYVEVVEASAFYSNTIDAMNFPALREIGTSAFRYNQLTRADLPNVETIGANAFANNKLTAVNLPVATEIGASAFTSNAITTLTASEVVTIGNSAFAGQPIETLDLPKVKTIGDAAFSSGRKLTSVSIPLAESVGYRAFYYNAVKQLDAPQLRTVGDEAFNSNYLTSIELPNVETIGSKAFRYNRITEAYLSDELTTLANDAFDLNRTYNSTRQPVMVFLPDGENPHGLEDGKVKDVLQHIINPTKVTVSYKDTDGNPLAESFTEYIFGEKTYQAINIFNYKVQSQTITVPDNRQVNDVVFVYDKRNLEEMNTEGVEIYQENEIDTNTQIAKTRYYIGDTMITKVYVDLTGFDATVTNGKIQVFYDPAFIDAKSIKIPAASSIKSYSVNNGMVEILLNPVSGGFHLEVPIEWRFKKYVTPDNYRMTVQALMANGDDVYSVAKPIYVEGYYNKPNHTKRSPLNIPDYDYGLSTSATNGPRLMGEVTLVRFADDTYGYAVTKAEPVEFSFTFSNLERYVSAATVTDTLPSYIAINAAGEEEARTAVFDPELNPAWTLSADGKTVVQEASFAPTLNPSAAIRPLYLSFPGLKSGANVVNHSDVVLVPDKKGANEADMVVQDDLSIYAVRYEPIKYEGDPRFDKDDHKRPWYDGNTAYFYDMQQDREKIIPYFLRVSSMAQMTDLVDVRITDYGLDDRLYYYGVSFPQSTGASGGLPVTVVGYAKSGATMNPATDPILQSVSVTMGPANNVVFDAAIAQDIDYVQIILPENHKVFSALEFVIDTKLRDPDSPHYTAPALSENNVFTNHAVMSGNLYLKNTTADASERTEPLIGEGGLIISQYDAAWDNIPGNYLWHEQAIVNIRDYGVDMGVGKTQTYPTTENVYPGQEGTYNLRLRPFVTGRTDEGEGRSVVREALGNFEMVDLLPKGVTVIGVTLSEGFKQSEESAYRIVDNYDGDGRMAVVFTATTLNAGVFDIAAIQTVVDPETEEGQVTNEVFATFDNEAVRKVGTKEAPPGQETDGRVWLKDQTVFNLIKVKELFARKYIKRTDSMAWLPTGIVTESGGTFDYRLSLINNLDEARSQIDIVDFFPYVGDVSIQEQNVGNGIRPPRESQFQNTFDVDWEVVVPAGYTVTYWNSDTPINYGRQSADAVIAGLTWSATPAANTRAIRVQAQEGVEIAPNGRLDVIVPMKAPANTVDNNFDLTGKRAYNTFVRKDNSAIRFLEPNRVYNELAAPVGSITFTKWAQDSVAGDAAQYTLAGAEFEIRDSEGNFVAKAVSDAEGTVQFIDLPIIDTYTIRETKAPEGFLPNTGTLTVTYDDFKKAYDSVTQSFAVVLPDAASKASFLNIKPLYGSLELEKRNGNGTPLQYIRFNLVGLDEWNADVNQTLITNAQGKITVPRLLEGRYRLTEVPNSNESGFVPVAPIEFTIDADHRDIRFVNDDTGDHAVINRIFEVLINKVAVGVQHDIDQSIKDLTDFGLKKLDGYAFVIKNVATGETIQTGVTKDGQVAVEGLEIETLYDITEVLKDGTIYRHNDNAYRFQVNAQGKIVDENGEPFRQNLLNFPNPEKKVEGKLRVVKLDDNAKPLEGAVFALFQNDEKVAEATSVLKDGVAEAIFENLTGGTYVLKEIQAPEGYIRSLVEYTIQVPYRAQENMVGDTNYTIEDDVITRHFKHTYHNTIFDVAVIKGDDILTNIPLADAEAYVAANPGHAYRLVGPTYATVYQQLEGVTFDLFKVTAGNREKIGSYTSGADGHVDLTGVTFAENTRYELVETATLPGYQLDARPIVIDTGFEAGLQEFDGRIERYKNNQPIKGRIILSKYDEDARVVLPGVTFALYAGDDTAMETPLQTAVTNASGVVEFRDLDLGAYKIKEIAVPEGYQMMPIIKDVTVSAETKTHHFVINNPQLISFDVTKKWVGSTEAEAVIRVTANGGTAYDIDGNELQAVTLNEVNGWKAHFEKLPKYDDAGDLIEYGITEEPIEGYTVLVTGTTADGFTVTNTKEGLLSVGVTKKWVGSKGKPVTIELIANGEFSGQSVVLSAENGWQHVFTDLPKEIDGEAIEYTVAEVKVQGYRTTYSGSVEEGFVVTNREIPDDSDDPGDTDEPDDSDDPGDSDEPDDSNDPDDSGEPNTPGNPPGEPKPPGVKPDQPNEPGTPTIPPTTPQQPNQPAPPPVKPSSPTTTPNTPVRTTTTQPQKTTTTTTRTIPRTGNAQLDLLMAGIFILSGGVLIGIGRRRRNNQEK